MPITLSLFLHQFQIFLCALNYFRFVPLLAPNPGDATVNEGELSVVNYRPTLQHKNSNNMPNYFVPFIHKQFWFV